MKQQMAPRDTAAIFVELEGGYIMPPKSFMTKLHYRLISSENKILVRTRCSPASAGDYFAIYSYFDVQPGTLGGAYRRRFRVRC